MEISILIPAYNEERTLPRVLEGLSRLSGVGMEVVISDDGSRDGTAQWLEKGLPQFPFRVNVARHAVNQGKGAAVRSALMASSGEIVVIQDADLEYDPRYIPALIEPIRSGQADVVFGSRLLAPESVTYSRLYLWGNLFLTWITNRLAGSHITDAYTGYKAFRRSVALSLDLESRGFEIEAEISMKVAMRKFRYREIPVVYHARSRQQGKKINWMDAVRGIGTLLRVWWREKNKND